MTRIMCNCRCSCFRLSAHTHTHTHPSHSSIFLRIVSQTFILTTSLSLSLSTHTIHRTIYIYDTLLQKAYTKLQRNGISFIETSMSYPPIANVLLNEVHSSCDISNNKNNVDERKSIMASTFPNVWKYAFTTRSLLPILRRRGGFASSIVSGAEKSCDLNSPLPASSPPTIKGLIFGTFDVPLMLCIMLKFFSPTNIGVVSSVQLNLVFSLSGMSAMLGSEAVARQQDL